MRVLLIGVSILTLAACSQAPERESAGEPSYSGSAPAPAGAAADSAERMTAPGIDVTAAPGVAFTYDYDFRLPAEKIGAAQEAHAVACEKLGISRCRITGMRYSVSDNGGIDARLAFKLDPTLARGFGKQGIATIEASDGMLIRAEITGNDAGGEIERIARRRAELAAERARIDRELARPGLKAEERAELQRQRAMLDSDDRAHKAASEEQEDSLATTPVTFAYESGTAINAFGGKGMIARALDAGARSVDATFAVALTAIAVLGPPILLIGLLVLGFVALRRRFFPAKPVAVIETE